MRRASSVLSGGCCLLLAPQSPDLSHESFPTHGWGGGVRFSPAPSLVLFLVQVILTLTQGVQALETSAFLHCLLWVTAGARQMAACAWLPSCCSETLLRMSG